MRQPFVTRCLWLLLVFSLACGGGVHGSATDSLVALHEQSANADERAHLAFKIATLELFSEPKFAARYLLATAREAGKVSDKTVLGKCYNALGIYYMQFSHDSSLMYLEQAIAIARTAHDEENWAKAIKNKGLCLNNKGDYNGAITANLEALEYFKASKDTAGIVRTLNDIGNTYLNLRNHDAGLKFQKEALSYLSVFELPAVRGNVLNSMGHVYDDLGKKDSAIYYYNQSLKIKEKYGTLQSILITRNNLCQCIEFRRHTQLSIDCFKELLALQIKADDRPGLIRSRLNLAEAYEFAGNHPEAIKLLKTARAGAADLGDIALLAQTYKKLASAYNNTGQYQAAYTALKQYTQYKDSVLFTERSKETIEMSAKYELAKKDHELSEQSRALLNSQNEKLKAELELKEKRSLLQVAGLLAGIGILSVIFFSQRYRARQEKEKMTAILDERQKGLKAIIDAQEEERTRIAKELHDGVGNQLLALQMSIKAKDKDAAHEVRVGALLKSVMDEVRTVSHQMMPRILQEFGCVPALEDMLEKTFGNSGITWNFETHQVDRKRYDPRLESAVFRISQELVNNIIKHAGATEVSVQLIETGNHLLLLVEDNGKGLDAGKKTDGIGITNIRSRASAVNGEINILSKENTSTAVTLRIPLS